MKIERIPVDAPVVGERHRKLDHDRAEKLAESLRAVGLLHPIRVYTPDNSEVFLVSGLHRLEAAKSLGWDYIDAVFMTGDEIDREMAEIAENLHRSELTAQERADHIASWVRLCEQKDRVSSQVATKQVGRPEGGARAAARDLGLDKDQVHRAIKIASITPEAREAADEAGLRTQRDRLEIAKAPPERQVAKVYELKQGTIAVKTWRDEYARLWARGTDDDHAWAREFNDKPVMDRRFGA